MNKWTKRFLLLCEIGGGFLGLALIAQSFSGAAITPMFVILNALFGGLFLFGIIAGLALVENSPLGLHLSSIYQAIQIPIVMSPYVTYTFTSGFMASAFLHVVTGSVKVGANFHVGSQFCFSLSNEAPWRLGVNVVALAFLVLLRKALQGQTEPDDGQHPSESSPNASHEKGTS